MFMLVNIFTVINVNIGEDSVLGPDERVIIDCGPLIDSINVLDPEVNWIHNDNQISNKSIPNVVISQDKRQCIITETTVNVGGQLGNGGNYTCKVCGNLTTCMSNFTIINICG